MEKVVGTLLNGLYFLFPEKALYWVHKLFATPRKGKIKQGEIPPFLQQATAGYFIYQGEKVYTYQWNEMAVDQPLILLVHGWESNSNRWEALVNYLGPTFRFAAFDAPSLGQSKGKNLSVKNYQEVIDIALQHFQPQAVVGHSLGAFTLFQQLRVGAYPQLKKAVILGSFDRFEHILTLYFDLLGYNQSLRAAYLRYIEAIIQRPVTEYSSSKATAEVHLPILCIHDQEDPQVSCQEAIAFHQALEGGKNQVFITHHLGHSLQDPLVFQTIQAFFS